VRWRRCRRARPPPGTAACREAARHFDEPALASLILHIALINAFNRLNAATGQVAVPW
jgi:alkylhydroperoxidase family enzyme